MMLGALTDTHPLIWYAIGQSRKLGARAREIFETADRRDGSGLIVVPSAVLHEVSNLLIGGRINLARGFSEWVLELENHGFIQIVDVTAEMVIRSDDFKQIHDPFDRLIMGCAALFEQPLITADNEITASGLVEVIWD
jgi:PIN domain nuclease of toxin-antitoxin system